MYNSRAVTPRVLISDDVINRILKLDIQTNILVYVTRCCTDLTSKVLKERTFGQSSAVLLRYFSRNSPFLQVFAHHIPDKLAVLFNSSSSLLSSYKWFLTIGSKYSFVKAYNVEISFFKFFTFL